MKKIILTILCILTFGISFLFSQIDTLNVVYEFDSPTLSPWGLTWDGTNLWISDNNSGKIYKSNTCGQTIDSIKIKNAQITGITFVNDTLWGLNTNIVDDTIINSSSYPIYYLYQINKTNGAKLDSLKIIGSATNFQSGDYWSLDFYDNKFYVSYNGGWGSCLIEIDRENNYTNLCCTHLLGMTVAYDSIWAIQQSGNIITTTNKTQEYWKYIINFKATDITFDNNNFWLVDTSENKIKKMEQLFASTNEILNYNTDVQFSPNPSSDLLFIKLSEELNIHSAMIFNINGQKIENISIDKIKDDQTLNISHLLNGVYFIKLVFDNGQITRKIIKN